MIDLEDKARRAEILFALKSAEQRFLMVLGWKKSLQTGEWLHPEDNIPFGFSQAVTRAKQEIQDEIN